MIKILMLARISYSTKRSLLTTIAECCMYSNMYLYIIIFIIIYIDISQKVSLARSGHIKFYINLNWLLKSKLLFYIAN